MTLFGLFFVAYLAAADRERAVFGAGALALDPWSGLVNTIVLLTSSFCVVAALDSLRAQRLRRARNLFGVTVGLGTVFVVVKTTEYWHLADRGPSPATDLFFTYYFVLTGIHLTHVLIGIALICACLPGCRGPDGHASGFAVGAGAYWHMVDALWMVLFPILYLVPAA
jgi:nitric oxide reductase NorE protein